MAKTEFAAETVGAPEGFRRERGQMVDVFGTTGTEKGLQERVFKHAGVEEVF
jgi:hypothetical protein